MPPPSNLYKVDPATGAATPVGNTGYAITGLAQDPTTGILYAVSTGNSPIAPLTLLTLNPTNGAPTVVGPLGKQITDLSFNSAGLLYGWAEPTDELASINKATGAATIVGPNTLSTFGGAVSFDRNDTLWLFGEGEEGPFDTVDLATGDPTERGKLMPIDTNESAISAAAWDCPRTTLYGTLNNFGVPPANLITVDVNSGAITNKGATSIGADGLEWYCPLAFELGFTEKEIQPGQPQQIAVPLGRGPRIKGAATVAYSTKDGSAKAGVDFKALSGTASFPNNVSAQSLSLMVTPDPRAGRDRAFTLELSNPSGGGSVGKPLTVTITTAKPRLKVRGPAQTAAERPTFKLRSNQLPAKFRCKLDGKGFKACGKNGKKGRKFKTRALKPGKHVLIVQAVNSEGRKSKPVRKKFVVLRQSL